eukprot:TCONS_00007729-protein
MDMSSETLQKISKPPNMYMQHLLSHLNIVDKATFWRTMTAFRGIAVPFISTTKFNEKGARETIYSPYHQYINRAFMKVANYVTPFYDQCSSDNSLVDAMTTVKEIQEKTAVDTQDSSYYLMQMILAFCDSQLFIEPVVKQGKIGKACRGYTFGDYEISDELMAEYHAMRSVVKSPSYHTIHATTPIGVNG